MQLPKTYAHVHLCKDSMKAEDDTTLAKRLNEWRTDHVKEARMHTEQNVDGGSSEEPVHTLVSELQYKQAV